jgi:hypothetical protein
MTVCAFSDYDLQGACTSWPRRQSVTPIMSMVILLYLCPKILHFTPRVLGMSLRYTRVYRRLTGALYQSVLLTATNDLEI